MGADLVENILANMIKSSQSTTSRVSYGQKPNVSETISASIIRGMM
jgi:hypothetical protein